MKTALRNGTILDAFHSHSPADLLVEDGIITSVSQGWNGEADLTVDLAGCTVMPGFFDAHVHIILDDSGFREDALLGWAKNGVVCVRDCAMLSGLPVIDYLTWLKQRNTPDYPCVLTSGKFIDVPGGYGSELPAGHPIGMLVNTPEDGRRTVRYLHGLGCRGIKIPLDFSPPPFTDQPRENGLSPELIAAICDEAKSLGLWVTCHALASQELGTLVDSGVTDAGHTPHDFMPDELIARMVQSGIPMVSTAVGPVVDPDSPPMMPPPPPSPDGVRLPPPPPLSPEQEAARARHAAQNTQTALENLRRFRAAGGTVLLGTDLMFSGNYPMCACIPVREMEALASVGFTQQELITAGTLAPARACGLEDTMGSLTVGKQASLIAIDRPIGADFRGLMAPPFVMNRGEIIVNHFR